MQSDLPEELSSCSKISCTHVPAELLHKTTAKTHFCKYGRIVRILLRPKSRMCTIEYESALSAQNALENAAEYNGENFDITWDIKTTVKKKHIKKEAVPEWMLDPEVQAELEIMGHHFSVKRKYNLRPEAMSVDPEPIMESKRSDRRIKKSKRTWTPESDKKSKKTDIPLYVFSATSEEEQLEMLKVLKVPAFTAEEKYKILDTRDKLIRLRSKKSSDLTKSSPTVGTCPDMCPEKERLMREIQHQVALYEQETGGKGMNAALAVKQYSRSSADQDVPLPHELRPVAILKLTMNYLMHRIMNLCDSQAVNLAEWYHFLWDRTRGIRKDIIQQELCCQGSVSLVEQCARFHIHCSARLVAEDPSVFDQRINTENLTKCLQTLKYMYHDLDIKGESCTNEAEFRAYVVLLNLNDGNFMWEVQQWKSEIQRSREIKFALAVYSALDKKNYVKFFKLVRSTTYLNACILLRYFMQVRIGALRTILKCYSPRSPYTQYPVNELTTVLAFEETESTTEFLEYYGLILNLERTHVVLDRKMFGIPEIPYMLDRAINVIESKRNCSVGETVYGDTLSPPCFEGHVPHDSFDTNGCLNVSEYLDDLVAKETELVSMPEMVIEPVKKEEKIKMPFVSNKSSTFQTSPSIFGARIASQQSFSFDVVDKAPEPPRPFWENKSESSANIFGNLKHKPNVNIFGKPVQIPQARLSSGGFAFDLEEKSSASDEGSLKTVFSENKPFSSRTEEEKLNRVTVFRNTDSTKLVNSNTSLHLQTHFSKSPQIILSPKSALITGKIDLEDRKWEEVLKKEQLKRELEQKRKKLEVEKQKLLRESRKIEEKRKVQEEQRREEERRRIQEINSTVTVVIGDLIHKVIEKHKQLRLEQICQSVKKRKIVTVIRKWQNKVATNKRKREVIDHSPIWVSFRTIAQEAGELYHSNQDLSLQYMKRYKCGQPIDFEIIPEDPIKKIDLCGITYKYLFRNYAMVDPKLQGEIFWKVVVSLPDSAELCNGLNRIEDTLLQYLQWNENDGHASLLQHYKPYSSNEITYYLEKYRGPNVVENNANGIIFVAKNLNDCLRARISDSLKKFRKYSSVSLALILESNNIYGSCLQEIDNWPCVFRYKIFCGNLAGKNLLSLINESLVFLAHCIQKPPVLELDMLNTFLCNNLSSELWKRVASVAKWNTSYRNCLKLPNVVISLYNEAVSKLESIIFDETYFEYPDFPEAFREYLRNEAPNFLPCDYKYFPEYWKNPEYTKILRKVVQSLKLPDFENRWPPENKFHLEEIILHYCTKVFSHPEKVFYKIMGIFLKDIDQVQDILWTEIIELIALEKIKRTNFSLQNANICADPVFQQLTIVYDVYKLYKYKTDAWFYVNNATIKSNLNMQELNEELDKRRDIERLEEIYEIETGEDLEKILSEVAEKSVDITQGISKQKLELQEFEKMLQDLEESVKIQRKTSSKFQETLKRVLEDKV